MAARFILSLDCEGKWGVADSLGAREHRALTDARLRNAYQGLLTTLDSLEVAATFAFVGLFAATRENFRAVRPALEPLALRSPGYLGRALHDEQSGSREGWHGDWAVEAVATARPKHEIALHGITHVPWTLMDSSFFREEMLLVDDLGAAVAEARTFVFPRNEIAHTEVLADAGLTGFRAARPARTRLRSLASEFNFLAAPEPDPPPSRRVPLVEIPAGYFFNWPGGLRKLVPPQLTQLRFRQMLRRASRSSEVMHVWLHPENIASEGGMLGNLRVMLEDVARARDAGECEVLTQRDYCARITGPKR